MTDTKNIEKMLKVLANYRRLEILRVLKSRKNVTVGEIAEIIKLSFKSTSRHLALLLASDLIDRNQISLQVYYTISLELPVLARQIISSI